MRRILLHPTHRKFVRIIRNRVNSGRPIILAKTDIKAFQDICQGTMTMLKRHQGIYRIVLTAANRPIEGIEKNEKVCVLGNSLVNAIEKEFSKAEWRHPWTTVLSGYVVPILQRTVNKRLAKRK
ncbi:MAG: hypothetical protein J6O51_03850 [Bacteroidales bacterium]|nr:hypothetical protein [Bacteroidales bacterium]